MTALDGLARKSIPDVEIRLILNGEAVTDVVASRSLLIDYLRNQRRLTGTKLSCDVQLCGACTVLVDGLPVSACTTLTADVDGHKVTTIEGLPNEAGLHPVQTAFAKLVAFQCGFCTPGMILSLVSLLESNPTPKREDVVQALEGNVCRCGTYPAVIEAIESLIAEGWSPQESEGFEP